MVKYLFIIAALITTSVIVHANEGFYVDGTAGANFLDSSDKDVKIDFDTGYLVSGSLGYKFSNGLRVEGEIGYRRNNLNQIKIPLIREEYIINSEEGVKLISSNTIREKFNVHGHLETISFLGHLLYELQLTECINPYIGAGAGYALQSIYVKHIEGIPVKVHGHQNGFAWDLLGGVVYSICENIDLDLQYRYFRSQGNQTDNTIAAGIKYFF